MADKFLSITVLDTIRSWVLGKLAFKQDLLVSGTNIKTINNTSLLGSGNIDISGGGSEIYIARQNESTYAEIKQAIDDGKVIYVLDNNLSSKPVIVSYTDYTTSYIRLSGAISTAKVIGGNVTQDSTVVIGFTVIIKSDNTWQYDSKMYYIDQTYDYESAYAQSGVAVAEAISGIANPAQNITLNANGQLEVGGRIGQFEGTTGLFAPNNRDPRAVGNYSFLMTDALGVDMSANRALAVVSGLGVNCRSAAAGTTEYRIQNTYSNRILAKMCEGGYAAKDEATSTSLRIVQVVSVTIGGAAFTPDSSANPSGTANDIIITTAETLNPDGAITNIRLFGRMASYATIHTGNGIASEGGGRNLLLGGGVMKASSSNDNCLIGNGIYSSGNGNACFGRYHIARKNRGFFAGTGHDSTNAPAEGASAVGQYSYMDANTLFAVGNGSNHTTRSNAFEVRTDGIVLKSPNGTRYNIAVADDGTLSATAL